MGYGFVEHSKVLKKEGLTAEILKEALLKMCDADYNGDNGEEYFISVKDKDGKELKMSEFEAAWLDETKDLDEADVIKNAVRISENILGDNYKIGNYYRESAIRVVEASDLIAIFVASMYCN